ncbi:MAG: DsbA family oxidoreductase [Solirubrobacterales bacterium]
MRIDFIFDTVCPWCYVGKRRLMRALSMRPRGRLEIRWRPFLLNPEMPLEGIDRGTYLDRKFGGPSRVNRIHSAVTAAGRAEGIDFAFDRISRTPSSLHSHRLVRFAERQGRDSDMVEAIYHAYFVEGLDIGAIDQLSAIAGRVGLDANEVRTFLMSDADITTVMSDNARAHRLGVNGVPCIIIDGQYALAGAQEPDILMRLIDIAREGEPEVAIS